MGASVDHLQRQAKTGRLSFRRDYPPEVRPFIAGIPVELKRSLGAKSVTVPGALDRFRDATAEFDKAVESAKREKEHARKVAAGAFDPLTPEVAEFLIDAYVSEVLSLDDEVRWLPRSAERRQERLGNMRG